MANVKGLKKSFSKWLSSRNESQEMIDEHIKNLEQIGKFYSCFYEDDFDIWSVDRPKQLETVLNSLTKKSFLKANPKIVISKLSLLMLKKYLIDINAKADKTHLWWRTQTSVDNEIDYREKLNEVYEYLMAKYSDNPAQTLGQMSSENKGVVNFAYMNTWTRALFGITASQFLVKKGLLLPNENAPRPAEERLAEIIDPLVEKYSNNPAKSYAQLIDENPELQIPSINKWTRKLHGVSTKDYLVMVGIIVEDAIDNKSKKDKQSGNAKISKSNNSILNNETSKTVLSARVLTLEEKTFLVSCLKDGFCILEDLRNLYSDKFPSYNAVERVNDATLRGISFRVYSDFVIRDKYRSAKAYFIQQLLDNDISDLNRWDSRVSDCQIVKQAIDELTYDYDLLEFDKKKYMTLERFTNVMPQFKRIDFLHYLSYVADYAEQAEYFTLKYLLDKGFDSPFHKLGFTEWFPASIIKNSREYKYIRIGGTFLFYKSRRNKTKIDFFKYLLLELASIEIDDFVDLLLNDYGIRTTRNSIINTVKDTSLYYDSIMDKIYYKKEFYYDEIK